MLERYLETGEIVNTHGVRGEVRIQPWADGPEFLLDFHTFYLNGKPYRVEQSRVHKSMVLCKLEGVDTVEAAAALRGTVVKIDREDANLPEGKVFVADLIGLPVYADGEQIGTLQEVLNYPASDVYVIRGEHEYMIPVVPEFVECAVPEDGIYVRLIEGMRTDEN
ncbi:MAG: 16S rRNA processing protein RimM [Oscillospiraceae bacterium]|nr:16S rRNA processing protein RimM [Oscillospiraceae bacterium]